ncbi:MAG TPA: AI-2E family transporter [Myxococcota bacterium]|nr:AI-2E family transporter [Myxococcota bacterium]HRY94514.1 AI-2E family transporter [Myxococcota bacterium]HSA20013.1 AI-2E family transporter [Myxococcota bacterium]
MPDPKTTPFGDDWRGHFYLHSFVQLSLADRQIERREQVWIKRYLNDHGLAHLLPHLAELIACGGCDEHELEELTRRAAAELSMAEKRRFIYNLAQLVQSKGAFNPEEHGSILDLAERLGVADTDADAIIRSVYSINDTFTAILGLLAIGVILYFTQAVIVPLVIAIFITMIIHKVEGLVARALGLRRFRWLNKIAAMVLILGVLFGLVMAAVVSARDIATRFPYYETRMSQTLQESPTAQAALAWMQENGVLEQLKQLPIGSTVSGFLGSLIKLLGNFVLVVIFTGFLVFSTTSFTGVLQEMNEKISAYITIKTLMSLLTGLVTYLLCWAFGVDFALFWATLGFLLNFIPSVGSIVATVPPILLAMVQLDSWAAIVGFAGLFVVLQVLMGQVLEPKLMGTRLAIKPVAILLGLIFWGFLWGIPGMFLATPLVALMRILSSYFNFSRGLERLLAADKS